MPSGCACAGDRPRGDAPLERKSDVWGKRVEQGVDSPAGGIAADSLAPKRVGELMFPIAEAHVASVLLVSDAAIREAQGALWKVLRAVTEPGGAAAFAALLSRQYLPRPGERVGVLLCGGNTTAVDFSRVTAGLQNDSLVAAEPKQTAAKSI